MIYVTEFKPFHLTYLEKRPEDACWTFIDDATRNDLTENSVVAKTFWDNDGPFACFGAYRWDDITCVAWFVSAPRIRTRARFVYVTLSAIIDREMATHNVRRLEAIVSAAHPYAERFVKNLGFEYEGEARRYFADGTDGKRYVYLRSDT